jgi:hypothetical protein
MIYALACILSERAHKFNLNRKDDIPTKCRNLLFFQKHAEQSNYKSDQCVVLAICNQRVFGSTRRFMY